MRTLSRDSTIAGGEAADGAAARAPAERRFADQKDELLRGLLRARARIDPKFFYDAAGCELFEAICRLPEYYLTRTEASIFARHGEAIARALPGGSQWVDLGCGDGAKSREWLGRAGARRYLAVDIAGEAVAGAVRSARERFPGIECDGIACDFSAHLDLHRRLAERPGAPPVLFYPGSSLGNFTSPRALAFLRTLRAHAGSGGSLLIGVDLVKDAAVLEAAYDDAAGVTAEFNRNVLRVANRLLDADFDPQAFDHRAIYHRAHARIEMRLVSRLDQRVRIGELTRHFHPGEGILTEYSHKYTVEGFARMLSRAGFSRQQAWTDAAGWFAVFHAQP